MSQPHKVLVPVIAKIEGSVLVVEIYGDYEKYPEADDRDCLRAYRRQLAERGYELVIV